MPNADEPHGSSSVTMVLKSRQTHSIFLTKEDQDRGLKVSLMTPRRASMNLELKTPGAGADLLRLLLNNVSGCCVGAGWLGAYNGYSQKGAS